MKKKKLKDKKESLELHQHYANFCCDFTLMVMDLTEGDYGLHPDLLEMLRVTSTNLALFENRFAYALGSKPVIKITFGEENGTSQSVQ